MDYECSFLRYHVQLEFELRLDGEVEAEHVGSVLLQVDRLVALVGYRLAEDGQFVVGDVLLHLLAQKLVDDVHLDGVAHLATDQAHRHLARTEARHVGAAAVFLEFLLDICLVVTLFDGQRQHAAHLLGALK